MTHAFVGKTCGLAVVGSLLLFGLTVDAAEVIEGRVVDRDGTPVSGAAVEMLVRDVEASRFYNRTETVADSDGQFQFDRLSGASAVFVANAKGFAPGISIVTTDSENDPFDSIKVILCEAASCEVRVRNERGEPVENARVVEAKGVFDDQRVLLSEQFHTIWQDLSQRSDANGILLLENLPVGSKLDLVIRHDDYVTAELEDVSVQAGSAPAVETTLQDGVAIELVVDGLADDELVAVDLRHQPFKSSSTIIEPTRLNGNRVRYVVEPGDYSWLQIMARGRYITPLYSADWTSDDADEKWFPISESATFHFDAIPTARVSGRIVHTETGEPLKGVYIGPSLIDSEATSDNHRSEKVYGESVETDKDGRFTLQAPIGRCRVDFEWVPKELGGFIPNPSHFEIDVPASGYDIGEWGFDPIPPVRGKVTHPDGSPAANMLVRFRGAAGYSTDPVMTDSDGLYSLPLRWIPVDRATNEPVKSIPVVAFDLHSVAAGMTSLDSSDIASFQTANITLELRDPWWPIAEFLDEFTAVERGEQSLPDAKDDLLGSPFPKLTATHWWNAEQPLTLESLRGRWVLLDYYFTNCGPCRGETPKLIQLHNEFSGDRFALIGVHIRRESIDEAAEYIEAESIPFPVLYCDAEGQFEDAAAKLGVQGYPSYVLIDPQGRVANAPRVGFGPSLRNNKLEVIRALLLTGAKSLPSSLYAVPKE